MEWLGSNLYSFSELHSILDCITYCGPGCNFKKIFSYIWIKAYSSVTTFQFIAKLGTYSFIIVIMAKQKYGIRQGLEVANRNIPALIEIPLHIDLQSYVRRNFKKVEEDVYVPVTKTIYDDGTGCLKKLEIGPKLYLKSPKVIMLVGATGSEKQQSLMPCLTTSSELILKTGFE